MSPRSAVGRVTPIRIVPPVVAPAAAAISVNDEVSALIEQLLEAGHRLEVLTAGQVDSVSDRGGRTTLLPHAQDELRMSEARKEGRYRGLLEAAPDAMVVVDQAGDIVLLNVQAEKQFGYSRDELVGQPVTNIIPDGFAERLVADDLRSSEDALAQVIGTGIELTALRKDGSEFPIEIMLSPLDSPEGILVTAAIRDITVRQAAEARYRGLLEAAPDAMVVVDHAGCIVLVNVQAEKQFGYRRDELLGQPVTNIIPAGFAERLVADDLRSSEDALAQVIGTGIELTALRKDASEFPIEIMLSPLQSVDGVLVTAAIRDITVRRASEARYRGLLEAAPDAMVVVDQAGDIVLLNVQAEKQFGYSRDELVGQPVTNIIPDGFAERLVADDLRSAEDALAQVIGAGIELTALRKDGSEFPIEIMLSPLDSPEGILVTAAIRDITSRKDAELTLVAKVHELHRSNEEARAMSLEVAHAAHHDFLTDLPNRVLLNDRISQAIALRRATASRSRCCSSTSTASSTSTTRSAIRSATSCCSRPPSGFGHASAFRHGQPSGRRRVRRPAVRGRGTGEDAAIVAKRMLVALASRTRSTGADLHVPASIGISVFPDDGADAETLIKNADTAMYQAKEDGRKGYPLLQAGDERPCRGASIHRGRACGCALERDEFVLHYQPKIDLSTGADHRRRRRSFRWQHPASGRDLASAVRPDRGGLGLILPIGRWVLREACAQSRDLAGRRTAPVHASPSTSRPWSSRTRTSGRHHVRRSTRPDSTRRCWSSSSPRAS